MVNIQAVRHKQRPIPSSQPYAYQNTQLHSVMHIEVLGRAWRCLETSRGPYTEPDPIWGHVHLTMDVSTYPVWTSGGPQAPPNAAKRFNIHGRVLVNALRCVWRA